MRWLLMLYKQIYMEMRKIFGWGLLLCFVLASCGPKPQYKTREGKRRLKKYNSIQYETPTPTPVPVPGC